MTTQMPPYPNHGFRIAGVLVGLTVALGACTHTDQVVTTASIPDDYRLRHPIAVQEADQSTVIFVGRGRGGLSPSQRTDVMGLGQTWLHEATGAITADLPVDTPNARTAADALREIRALLAAAGVPPRGLIVHRYHPDDPRQMATIRLSYPKDLRHGRSVRHVARGSRSFDQGQELFRKQVVFQFRLRLSAQHGGNDRQPGGPGTAKA